MPDAPTAPLPALRLDESVEDADLLVPPVTWTPEFEEYREAQAAVLAAKQTDNSPLSFGLVFVLLPLVGAAGVLIYPSYAPIERQNGAMEMVRGLQTWIPFGAYFMLPFAYAFVARFGRAATTVMLVVLPILAVAAEVAAVRVVGSITADVVLVLFGAGMFMTAWWTLYTRTRQGGHLRKIWDGESVVREEHTVTLRREGAQSDLALRSAFTRWPGVVKVSETQHCLLLHTGEYGFVSIPRRAFPTPAAYDRFAQVARERAGRRTAFEVLAKPQAAGAPIPPIVNPADVRYAAAET